MLENKILIFVYFFFQKSFKKMFEHPAFKNQVEKKSTYNYYKYRNL